MFRKSFVIRRTVQLVNRLGLGGATAYLAGRLTRGLFMPAARFSWSQFGEDLVVRDILGLERGYYVDVGCNHPVHWSNTFLFYLHGWNGILVDGNQSLIDACKRRRPADTAICCLLGAEEGEGEITIYDDHALSSAVAFVNEERRTRARVLEKKIVPIRTLTNMLAEHAAPATIDFLSIDVEGMDLMVLQGLDFTKYRPRLIAIEDAAFQPLQPLLSTVTVFLTKLGYTLYSHVHPTLFFVDRDVVSKSLHHPGSPRPLITDV